MSPTLEDELSAGLREHAAGLHPSRDVLAAARARHRRRTVVTRAASAAGTVGLAGAVATVVAISGPVTGTPSPGPATSAPAAVELDAATVSARISQALLAWDDSVHHVRSRITVDGKTQRSELWEDPVTGDTRYRSTGKGSSPQPVEMAVRLRGTVQTTTVVDAGRRVWWTDVQELDVVRPLPEGPLGDFSPDGLRGALAAGTWELVGTEELAGRDTVHLRVTEQSGFDGEYDLWVDAASYQFVRRTSVSATDTGSAEHVEDWEYLPRTEQTLSELRFVGVPKGFKKIPAPEAKG
jgi:hypothetical protein